MNSIRSVSGFCMLVPLYSHTSFTFDFEFYSICIFVCLKCIIKNMSFSVCDLWLFLHSSLLLNVNIARLNLILIFYDLLT